jgi:hypothetical protein
VVLAGVLQADSETPHSAPARQHLSQCSSPCIARVSKAPKVEGVVCHELPIAGHCAPGSELVVSRPWATLGVGVEARISSYIYLEGHGIYKHTMRYKLTQDLLAMTVQLMCRDILRSSSGSVVH